MEEEFERPAMSSCFYQAVVVLLQANIEIRSKTYVGSFVFQTVEDVNVEHLKEFIIFRFQLANRSMGRTSPVERRAAHTGEPRLSFATRILFARRVAPLGRASPLICNANFVC